jgi:hypothetical protein
MMQTSALVVSRLRERGVRVEVVDEFHGLIRCEHDGSRRYSRLTMPSDSSAADRFVANQKPLAARLAADAGKSGQTMLQRQVSGVDIQVLVIGGRLVAAVARRSAQVTRNGRRSVRELIRRENATDPLLHQGAYAPEVAEAGSQ